MEWLYRLIANSSDAALLVGGVVCTAVLALVLALTRGGFSFHPTTRRSRATANSPMWSMEAFWPSPFSFLLWC